MRAKGISYDTGFTGDAGLSRPEFDPDEVRRELEIIRDDLHCTAVRVIGGDADRLEVAAAHAADLGLEVWFSPYPLDRTADEALALFADCAERAERIRRRGAEVVFVTGAELSIMLTGFLPGDSISERLTHLLGNRQDRARLGELVGRISAEVNEFLGKTAKAVRYRFGGRLTYASIPLERVDWEPFDLVGVDLYRSAEVADVFRDGVRTLVAQGKPVAITEFGSTAYEGAGDLGALVMEIVETDEHGAPLRLDGVYVRDEEQQATYIRELLEIFDAEGVDSAFVFLFALHSHPHRPDGDPRDDLDLASPGIVKVLDGGTGTTYPGLPWEPKAAFTALGKIYGA